jgi:ABC-type transport system involved in cytochrome c biogenesis permease subunit
MMDALGKVFPFAVLALALTWFLSDLREPSTPPDTVQIHEFGKIPVVEGGRVKPMDTVARTHLRIVSNRETFKDASDKRHPAVTWLLDVETEFADSEQRARKHPVFRIDHPSLRDALGLPPRETYRYSIEEFGDKLGALAEPLKKAHERKDNKQPIDAYENQLLEFERHLGVYERLARFATPNVIPPHDGKDWMTLGAAAPKGEQVNLDPQVDAWRQMLLAYGSKDAAKFNAAVKSYREKMSAELPKESRKAALEAGFNHLDPFNKCKVLYVVGFLLACFSWIGWRGPLNWSAWGLLGLVWIFHTISLGIRIYLSGRPPVTNLYSSAVFIGWGGAFMGLVLAIVLMLVLKSNVVMSLGSIVAGVAGFATLQIAYVLAADGDTMEVLQAVLDTQIWLATHVVAITLGYTATYVAGLLGAIYILMGVFTKALTPRLSTVLAKVTYGVICFATFFSFVGTVLGGLWADDSWGRFWGWDPKENGALMIVLWNAIVLHSRWGGMARERGIAMLAVFGNIVVSWSWFGVNQLGVGLHSYGFTSGVTVTLLLFAISQAAIIGFALFPREIWRSKLPLKGASAEAKIEADA